MPAIFFVIMAAAVLSFIAAGARRTRRVMAVWGEAAAQLGLDMDAPRFGLPRLTGSIQGRRLSVAVHRQQQGKHQQNFTRYEVEFPHPGFGLELTRQAGVSKITKWFGAQDVETGDPPFDDAFVVKTDDEGALRLWLDAGRRGTLVRTAAAYPGLQVRGSTLRYQTSGLESDRGVLVSTIRRLVDTADGLGGRPANDRAEDVVESRRKGELAEMARRFRGMVESAGRSIDERILEADTLATADERRSASERIAALEKEVPADPDVAGWRRRLATPPAPSGDALEGPDPDEIAEALFAGTSLSFESKQVFDERYRGASVRWSGRFKSTETIHRDSDLGPEGATRLIATVAMIRHDLYGNTDIDAVVGLPAGAGAELRRGDEVVFSGKLVNVDPLVRNLFVADGKLEDAG